MKNIGMVSETLNRNTLKCCLLAKLKEFAWRKVLLIVFLFFQVRIDTCTLLLSTYSFLKSKGSDTVKHCAQ